MFRRLQALCRIARPALSPRLRRPSAARLQTNKAPGHADRELRSQSAELIDIARSCNFDCEELEGMMSQYKRRAGADGRIDIDEFHSIMRSYDVNDKASITRLFRAFDASSSGFISFREFVAAVSVLVRGTPEERTAFQFRLYDDDNSGRLNIDEFRNLMKATRQLDKSLSELEMNRICDETFRTMDRDGNGKLTYEEYRRGVLHSIISLGPLPGEDTYNDRSKLGLSHAETEVISLLGDKILLPTNVPVDVEDKERAIYVVVSGCVNVVVAKKADCNKTSKDSVIFKVLPGPEGFFCESEIFAPVKDPFHYVSSSEGTEVVKLSVADLMPLLLNNHKGVTALVLRLGKLMTIRLGRMQTTLDSLPSNVYTNFVENRKELLRQWALHFHTLGGKGKLGVHATKTVGTGADLAVAYSPGVAEPCLAIERNPDLSFEYTSRGHLVGVISNGTAVLGLGNIGALASKPVMEGKAILFKNFGGVDSFDIEINEADPHKLIQIVRSLEPTFGGICLEDIKSPECFFIETQLQEQMNIPVMHDDQHGTAVVAASALLNAMEIVGKSLKDIKVVFSGCGAAGFTCAKYFLKLGVRRENLVACDIHGVVYDGRPDLKDPLWHYLNDVAVHDDGRRTLREVMLGCDVFFGLSAGNLLKPDMLAAMADNPVVFAMANPTPEINYELATKTRSDVIMCTGRSDLPNQVNNVSCFPFIFRGALDCRSSAINHEMKMAVTNAIARLAKTEEDGDLAGVDLLPFGRTSIIPKPFDRRLLLHIAPAVAQAAMETGVARVKLNIDAYKQQLREKIVRDASPLRR